MIAAWLVLSLTAAAPQGSDHRPLEAPFFDVHFTGLTLRFDYYHSGAAGEEHISLDTFRQEGPWPGSRTRLVDDTNLGKFLFQVIDLETHRVLYSRGFASIYGEWETTGEARGGTWRTFHESQRLPEPRRRAQVVLKKRDGDGAFREIYSGIFDPDSRFVDRSPIPRKGEVGTLFEHGPPNRKVDLLVLGDGYTAAQLAELEADVRRLMGTLFETEPFARHREDFNVRWVGVPSESPGITDPRAGTWLQTPLGLSYNAFDSERYILTYANRQLRELAAQAPYDALILLANSRKYGGGGIFNLWTTAAAGSGQADYLVVHEFGHSFAGLADEYYTSQVSYQDFNPPGVEPWEPNITALLDPERLKWKHLVGGSTPLPTPWSQERYDEVSLAFQRQRQELRAAGASEERMEELFAEVKAATRPMLEAEPFFGKLGAFEGAGYQAKGLYRSSADCLMFTRNPRDFCPVCSEAVERVIRLYAE